jgi:hypothetical protein
MLGYDMPSHNTLGRSALCKLVWFLMPSWMACFPQVPVVLTPVTYKYEYQMVSSAAFASDGTLSACQSASKHNKEYAHSTGYECTLPDGVVLAMVANP